MSQGAVAAIHHAHMVAAGRIERAKLAIDLHGRLRLAKPPPASLFANRQRTHLRGAVERLTHLLRIAVGDDGAIVISHREPQDARLPGHLFQQGLQLRVVHPHSHANARAGLQRADQYAPLLLDSLSGGGRLTTVVADDHRGEQHHQQHYRTGQQPAQRASGSVPGKRFDLHRRVLVISFSLSAGSFSRNHAMFPRGQTCSQTYRLRFSE